MDEWTIPGRAPEKDRRALRRHHLKRMKALWRKRFDRWDRDWLHRLALKGDPVSRERLASYLAQVPRNVGIRASHPRHFCRMCSLRTRLPEISWRDEPLLEMALEAGTRVLRDLGRRAPAHYPRVDGRPRLGSTALRFRPWLQSGDELEVPFP